MIAYECKRDCEDVIAGIFVGTMADAKAWLSNVKGSMQDWERASVRIYEVDAQTDKEGVLAALNWTPKYKRKREWQVTPRWGLKEVEL